MSGLEKIISKINLDNEHECELIIKNAEKKAEATKANAEAEANTEADEILSKAKLQCELNEEKAQSGSALLEKKLKLKAKNQIISEIIEKSKSALNEMSDNEYFEIVRKLIKAYVRKGEGELIFSAKDIKRLPSDFEKNINSELNDGAAVKISSKTADIDGGFILSYADIEENCAFDALIETNLDTIRDRLNSEIFA